MPFASFACEVETYYLLFIALRLVLPTCALFIAWFIQLTFMLFLSRILGRNLLLSSRSQFGFRYSLESSACSPYKAKYREY
jgi:hypothetical protein